VDFQSRHIDQNLQQLKQIDIKKIKTNFFLPRCKIDAVQKVISFAIQILQKTRPNTHFCFISEIKPGIITVVVTSKSAIASDISIKFVG
jgi:hypothetical protein